MNLGLLSRAKIGAYCNMKFAVFDHDLAAVFHKFISF